MPKGQGRFSRPTKVQPLQLVAGPIHHSKSPQLTVEEFVTDLYTPLTFRAPMPSRTTKVARPGFCNLHIYHPTLSQTLLASRDARWDRPGMVSWFLLGTLWPPPRQGHHGSPTCTLWNHQESGKTCHPKPPGPDSSAIRDMPPWSGPPRDPVGRTGNSTSDEIGIFRDPEGIIFIFI